MHECPSIGARCSVALSMTSHLTPSKRYNPCKYILSPGKCPTPTTSNVYADICRFPISTYHIPLESYKDKLSTGISPAYVLFGRDPTLPLEHAMHIVTDGPV